MHVLTFVAHYEALCLPKIQPFIGIYMIDNSIAPDSFKFVQNKSGFVWAEGQGIHYLKS